MNALMEQLFRAWCPPYDPARFPEYLQGDPVLAYGQYAFAEGVKLGMQLAVTCLDQEDLQEIGE